jgi:carnitine-CoA ligase
VIGIPDSMRDEAVKAFVVRVEGAQVSDAELTEWCAVRLAKFKVPSAIEFVETLPRTSVGKIQKEKLRQRATPLK